jgi:hypothetical protein
VKVSQNFQWENLIKILLVILAFFCTETEMEGYGEENKDILPNSFAKAQETYSALILKAQYASFTHQEVFISLDINKIFGS